MHYEIMLPMLLSLILHLNDYVLSNFLLRHVCARIVEPPAYALIADAVIPIGGYDSHPNQPYKFTVNVMF